MLYSLFNTILFIASWVIFDLWCLEPLRLKLRQKQLDKGLQLLQKELVQNTIQEGK